MAPPPTFALEDALGDTVAGVDEVGRGPWAGPVVACAVILDRTCVPTGLADSKALSAKRREATATKIRECAAIGLGVVEVPELDRLGVGKATLLAMERAIGALPFPPQAVLADGTQAPRTFGLPCRTVPRADALSASVAAASIVAKVHRDAVMTALGEDHPAYDWAGNKGYGTRAHAAALEEHGVTDHHRRSFAPIRRLLETSP